jgi:hypothetical protein
MGEQPWDRTHLACTRDSWCTRDACGPRRTLPMDQPRIFIGDTRTPRTAMLIWLRVRIGYRGRSPTVRMAPAE